MRLRTGLILAVLVPLLSGCSTLRATMDGWGQGADGLSRPQRRLRDALSGGDMPTALGWKEDDALLRTLTAGTAAYYAAQYERSAMLLDTAVLLADERLTASVSKNALSLVTNDMARPWTPRRTERLFVSYYGMLAWSRLERWEDAAVEARRMTALLQQYANDRDQTERALHAAMHHLAGAVFERAGEGEAAAVAYRNAHALVEAYPEQPVRAADDGEVLVVVERGFVAHRSTETIDFPLGVDDRDELRGTEDSRRRVISRIGDVMFARRPAPPGNSFQQREVPAPPAGPSASGGASESLHHEVRQDHDHDDDHDDDVRHLTLAFPALRRSPRPWAGSPRLTLDSAATPPGAEEVHVSASVDDASEADERRERAGVVTRELARAVTRYAATSAVRDKHGKVAGTLAELGAGLLERADVRSWHLLPQELVVMRIRLPAGEQRLAVEVGDGANFRRVSLGSVNVRRGMVSVVPARFWREPAPTPLPRCEYRVLSCER